MKLLLAVIQYPRIDPIIFQVGPVAIRWYGIAYLLGFVLGYLWLRAMVRRGMLRLTLNQLGDLLTWLILGVILGGRTGWWIFYHRYEGVPEPWYEPVAVWHGGMAFHGALVGVFLVMFFWTRRYRVPFWNVADCAALVTPVGLFFGRIANFINKELVGRASNLPWAVQFPGPEYPEPRHPSQIYEALLEGPVLLGCLWLARRLLRPRGLREGQIAALFIIVYGIFRFLVEFTREPDSQLGFIAFGWLTMGQILSALIVLAGVALCVWTRRNPPVGLPASEENRTTPEPKPTRRRGR